MNKNKEALEALAELDEIYTLSYHTKNSKLHHIVWKALQDHNEDELVDVESLKKPKQFYHYENPMQLAKLDGYNQAIDHLAEKGMLKTWIK